MRPLLYVAAPYTLPEPVHNLHGVCRVAMEIYERTVWCPIVPHLSLVWQAVTPRGYDHWIEYDLHIMRQCQAVVRLPGHSPGADGEVEEAKRLGIRILSLDELPAEALKHWHIQNPLA